MSLLCYSFSKFRPWTRNLGNATMNTTHLNCNEIALQHLSRCWQEASIIVQADLFIWEFLELGILLSARVFGTIDRAGRWHKLPVTIHLDTFEIHQK